MQCRATSSDIERPRTDSPPATSFSCISISQSRSCIGRGGSLLGRTSSSVDWPAKWSRISTGDLVVVDVVVTNVSCRLAARSCVTDDDDGRPASVRACACACVCAKIDAEIIECAQKIQSSHGRTNKTCGDRRARRECDDENNRRKT